MAFRRKTRFKYMKSWQLCLLGSASALGAALTAYMLGRLWPEYIKVLEHESVFTWVGLRVSCWLAGIALVGVLFAALGKRCCELLYQRHLD